MNRTNENCQALGLAGLELNAGSRQANIAGQELTLTGLEFDLLQTLIAYSPEMVKRQQLMWFLEDRTSADNLTVHVSNIRRKIAKLSTSIEVKAVRGQGYYLIARSVK